jgi:hypothetical protein
MLLVGIYTLSAVRDFARDNHSGNPTPLEWKDLLIVKAEGQIQVEDLPEIRYEMTPADITAVNVAFTEYTPDFVKTLRLSWLDWKPEVVVSPLPLRKVSKLGEGYWVGPECVAEDLDKHVTPGMYDGIFVYWKGTDNKTNCYLKGGFGWTIGPDAAAKGSSYTCVNFVQAQNLTRESGWSEAYLHEGLHQLEVFCDGKGVKLPSGGLHGDPIYRFKHEDGWNL